MATPENKGILTSQEGADGATAPEAKKPVSSLQKWPRSGQARLFASFHEVVEPRKNLADKSFMEVPRLDSNLGPID